ncbi:alpha/beta hydrolase [Pelagibacterium halotolerans]|uniref:alpha/beta hydrolase n=1 Tax=Pelagibacterium halotolerans TaxID=531813 RepID=UPI00384F1CEB
MKMFLLSALGGVAGIAVVVYLAFQLSPWPSALIIRQMFTMGDKMAMGKLEKHLPSNITERLNLAYGDGPNEIFDLFYPQGTDGPLPTIVWTHGGGWVAGSKEGVDNYVRILASHGYTAVSLDYTIAPEATYPTPVKQVTAALAHLIANAEDYNIDPNRIVLAGDSAGAQITAQIANLATAPDYAEEIGIAPAIDANQIAGLLLFCGAYDLDMADQKGAFAWFVHSVLWAYSGKKDFMSDGVVREASVIDYVTPAFPPTFITAGNGDPLEPQSVAFARKLESVGIEVDSLFYPKNHSPSLPHEYQFNLDIPDGEAALSRILAFLGAVFAETPEQSTHASGSHQPS